MFAHSEKKLVVNTLKCKSLCCIWLLSLDDVSVLTIVSVFVIAPTSVFFLCVRVALGQPASFRAGASEWGGHLC